MRVRSRQILTSLLLLVAAAPLAIGQQRPQFRGSVNRVRVDVIVTDEEGRFVDDLKPEDFALSEDGVPQRILSVELVDLAPGRVADVGSDAVAAAAPAGGPPVANPTSEAGGASSAVGDDGGLGDELSGKVIMLIDLVGLRARTKARFAVYFEHWLERTDALRVPWAVYMLDDQSQLYELAALGTDPAPVLAAVRWFRDFRWVRGAPISMLNDRAVRAEALAAIASSGPRFAAPRFAAHLGTGLGRTALVWVTARSTGTFLGREIFRAANSASVSIYVLDPTLRTLASIPIANAAATFSSQMLISPGPGGLMSVIARANDVAYGRRRTERDIAARLQEAAEATGGALFTNWMDFDAITTTIEAETSRYYLLTYAPPPPEADGRYHEIDVTVQRPEVTVRARQGYIDYDPERRREALTNAFRTLPGVGGRVGVEAEAFLTWTPDGNPSVILATAVDPSELGFIIRGDVARIAFGLRATVFNRGGEPIADVVDLIEGPASPAGPTSAPGRVTHASEWRPEAAHRGRLSIEVVIVDQASNRSGQQRLTIEVPERAPGDWDAGTPMLAALDGDALTPLVGGHATPDQQLGIFVQVVNGLEPSVRGQLLAVADPAANAEPDATPISLSLDTQSLSVRGRVHEGLLRLPGDLAPGNYAVELTIEDVPADERRTARLPLRVLRAQGRFPG